MTAPDLDLRDVGPFDGAVISALHVESFGAAGWSLDAVAEILAMPGFFGFLLAVGDRPAGFVLARMAADECEILSLGVGPKDRRRGLGCCLLRATVTCARALGARVIHLEVAKNNVPAIMLYRSHGFQCAGRRPAYYRHPGEAAVEALLLSRDLA